MRKLRTHKLKEKSEREKERESNSSLRRLLGLKDFGSESMDEEERINVQI
jgi:hypothetical protein